MPAPASHPPTLDVLAGIWVIDRQDTIYPGLLVRFGPDGSAAFEPFGRLDIDPAVRGAFAVLGDTISFTVGPGSSACVVGDTFAWRAGVSADGRMEAVTIEDGAGSCRTGIGNLAQWTRVSPASPAGAAIRAMPPDPRAMPPSSPDDLEGGARSAGRRVVDGRDRQPAVHRSGHRPPARLGPPESAGGVIPG